MKVIITGATGLVGSAVVRQCIANSTITESFILTRKPLPTDISENSKLTVIIHEDFGSYPPELLAQLNGARLRAYCFERLCEQFSPSAERGKGAEWDQTRSLWFLKDTRQIKGNVEKHLVAIADNRSDIFTVTCVRPSGVISSRENVLKKAVYGRFFSCIENDHLAEAMVKLLLDGSSKMMSC